MKTFLPPFTKYFWCGTAKITGYIVEILLIAFPTVMTGYFSSFLFQPCAMDGTRLYTLKCQQWSDFHNFTVSVSFEFPETLGTVITAL